MTYTCHQCGQPITGRRMRWNGARPTRYCSRECNIRAMTLRRAAQRPPRQPQSCEWCYALFVPRQRGQRFCCSKCGETARRIAELKPDAEWLNKMPTLELVYQRAANVRALRGTPLEVTAYHAIETARP